MREEIFKILKYQYDLVQKSSLEIEMELSTFNKYGDFIHSINTLLDKNDKYLYMLEGIILSKLVDILLFGRREYRLRLTPNISIEEATLLNRLDSYYKTDDINKESIMMHAIKEERKRLGITNPNFNLTDIIMFNYQNINTLLNDENCVRKLSSNPTFLHTTLFMMRYFPEFYFDTDILDTTKEIIYQGNQFYQKSDQKHAKMIIKNLDKIYPEEEKILEMRKFW